MKTLNELRAFCEGVFAATDTADLPSTDSWIDWGGYDVNFFGADYSDDIKNPGGMRIDAYKAGWTNSIGDPIHSFTL